MDKIITDFIREYHVFLHHAFGICGLIIGWLAVTGAIRFGIAIYRRNKGVYPPATSQMEDH